MTIRYDNSIMVKLECTSHYAAAIITSPTDTRVCCIGLLSVACACGTVPSKYLPSSHHLRTTDVYQ